MKKLNNKGFSLVEILAAIAILAILMAIASTAYNRYKRHARQQAYDTMAKSTTTAAKNYMMENVKQKYITFEALLDQEYIDTLQDPRYREEECTGIVINKVMQGQTQKQLDVLFQKVKLCCKNYKYQYDYTGDDVVVTKIDSCEYVPGDEIDGVYKLIYKSQGGTKCDPEVVIKNQGEEWGPLCVTTKDNSVFKGWNTKKSGSGTTITEHTIVGEKDVTAYAIWSTFYTLTFNEEGGSTCDPKTITKESREKWGTLCAPTKTGYAFKGWRTGQNGEGTKITQNTTAEKNLNVYAHWNPYYTLTYDSNGGSTCENATVTQEKGEAWGTLCEPTRAGYVFAGWKNGTATVTATSKATADITVKAEWTKAKYTLTYDSNGGSTCSPSTVTKELNEAWGALCEPTRKGYTFGGWKDGTTTVTATSKATANITVKAQWTKNNYTLTYNSDGGSTCNPNTVTKPYNEAWGTLCEPTKTGYTFAGWKNGSTAVTNTSKATANITVTAQWKKNTYTLKYDSNGGSACSPASVKKGYNEAWGTLCEPTRKGYTFAGWKNGSTTINSSSKATANITVTAQWSQNTYTLKYDSNGGSTCNPASITKAENAEWGTLCSPTKTGYKFAGWKNGSTTVTATSKATANITVKAQWTANSYTLTYNNNGGSGCTTKTGTYGSTWGTLCTPTKTGYKFSAWKDGSTTVTSSTTVTGNRKVTAEWTGASYTLTYNNNGGSGCTTKTGTYNSTWGTLCTPTRAGYSFVAWKDGSTTVTSNTTVTGNRTVTAQWTTATYTLTYNNNGGSGCTSKTGTYNSTWGTLCTPTRSGYTFSAWKDGSTTVTANTTVTGNRTVTAQWTAVQEKTLTETIRLVDSFGAVAPGYDQTISCKTTGDSCTVYSVAKAVYSRSGTVINLNRNLYSIPPFITPVMYQWTFPKQTSGFVTDSTTGVAGLNARSGPGTGYSVVDGLDVGHHFIPNIKFAYDSSSACGNHIWMYGKSYEEGWSGWVCSYYLY